MAASTRGVSQGERTALGDLSITVRRLFALWRIAAQMDLIFLARDLRASLSYLISDAIMNVAKVTGVFLLAERFSGLGEWTMPRLVFMLGYAVVVNGVIDVFFSFNVAVISRRLGRGQLDHVLVQPQPLWMALLTEGFVPFTGFSTLVVGLVILAWGIQAGSLGVTLGWTSLLLVNVIASTAVVLAFSFIWGSLAFWAPRAAEEISSSALRLLEQLKPYPLDPVRSPLRGGLLTVLPTGFVAWLPSRFLLGLDPSPLAACLTPLAAVAFGVLAALAFKKGLAHYARVGSQRYSDFGHRR